MKAFITGIAGFTGKHLKELLESQGVKVTGIDLKKVKGGYQGDLSNKSKLEKILNKEKPDYIFHLASPIIRSQELIDKSLQKNLAVDLFSSVNLLQTAAQLKKKPKILITGTAAVYKAGDKKPFKEIARLEPQNSYGLSKLTQELVCLQLAKSYKLKLVCTRAFLLIGPGQRPGWVITDLGRKTAEIERGKIRPVLVIGNLNIKRDFLDVRDGVKAYWLLIRKGKAGEVYNVCSGKAKSIKQVVNGFKQLSKKQFKIKQKNQWRKNDPNTIVGDNQKLRGLGWQPKISFKTSLQDTLDYWRKELKA